MKRTRFEQEMDDLGLGKRFFESADFPKFDYDTSSPHKTSETDGFNN